MLLRTAPETPRLQNGPLRLPGSTAIVIARDDLSMDHCLGSGPLPWCMGDVVCPQGIRLLRLSWPVGTHPTGGAAQRIVTQLLGFPRAVGRLRRDPDGDGEPRVALTASSNPPVIPVLFDGLNGQGESGYWPRSAVRYGLGERRYTSHGLTHTPLPCSRVSRTST
jgi:hypothetical protein